MFVHSPGPRLLVAAVLALAACDSRDPTPLANMGDADVLVSYALMSDAAIGSVDVYLAAAEGCPTFIGDATLNDAPLDIVEAGHTDAGSYYLIPTSSCVSPRFEAPAPDIVAGDSIDIVLTDTSDTWTVGSATPFDMGYTAPATASPGDTFTLEWAGPFPATYPFLQAWRGDRDEYLAYTADATGTITVTASEDLAPGPLRLVVEANAGGRSDTCNGFAACGIVAKYGREFTLQIE
jgi:hypothetical protein